MKIMIILGTRPEIIRLSRIITKLDTFCQLIVVHTGQNYDNNLNGIFFEQMNVRNPDYYIGAKGSLGEQISKILLESERIFLAEKPDKVLILGDTNSCLSVIMAKRLGIPVYHMEAGNRCYDDRVPEEINRRIVDHSSDILMPYTERSRQNLLREGISNKKIFVTGNPIYEVIQYYDQESRQSKILSELNLLPQSYFLVTVHRQENVDIKNRLFNFAMALAQLQVEYQLPIIVSTHPRTSARISESKLMLENEQVRFLKPFGFFDFITLERNAFCVLSDSGTVQEECAILGVPNVTVRDVSERLETLECGSGILSGIDAINVLAAVNLALKSSKQWVSPSEYKVENVSEIVIKIIFSFFERRLI